MSFNRELKTNDIDMNGHSIVNVKPQYLDKHPNTLGLFVGFEYFNTVEKVKYLWDGDHWIVSTGKIKTINGIPISGSGDIKIEGKQGVKGDKGDKGDVGPKGDPGKDGVKGDKGTDGKNADLTIAAGVGLSYNTKTEKIDLGTSTANDGTEYDLKTLGEIINKLESRITALESNV